MEACGDLFYSFGKRKVRIQSIKLKKKTEEINKNNGKLQENAKII